MPIAEVAARARFVVDHHRLAERRRERLGDEAADDVGRELPGGNGTTSLMGRAGRNACANAGSAASVVARGGRGAQQVSTLHARLRESP